MVEDATERAIEIIKRGLAGTHISKSGKNCCYMKKGWLGGVGF